MRSDPDPRRPDVQPLGSRPDAGGALPRRLLILCTLIGFAALIAAGIAAAWATARNQTYTGWVNHTYEVGLAVADADTLVERSETSRRGFLLAGEQRYRDVYDRTMAETAPAIGRLATLTADNQDQQRRIAALRAVFGQLQQQRDRTIALTAAGRVDDARRVFVAEGNALRMQRIRDQLAAMRQTESRLLAQRTAAQRGTVQVFYIVLALAAVLLALVAITSLLTVLRYTRDLGAASDRLHLLNDTLEDQVAERTADLTRANDEIQRFAYIVSHDLRSPLVNVLGFTAELDAAARPLAELVARAEQEAPAIVTEEARLAAREDLPEAIGFIRTSTQKMDRLINAILKLSREGRRTVTPEPLDLAALVDGIAGSIRLILDERGAELVVERPLPPVDSDRLAVEQILSNLIENAVKYAQPGRPARIVVRGRREPTRVLIEVVDNGRGIAAADHQRVFDLFRRSGQQDQPGEGIGLAHVRALAYRLGGTVDVQSTFGEGSTFRLILPATPPALPIEPQDPR